MLQRHTNCLIIINIIIIINSTAPITQIPWPSSTLHDLLPTESTHVWSSNDRVLVE